MLCGDCKYWQDVGHASRRRCALAAPIKGDKDVAQVAMTTGLDGCASGKSKDKAKSKKNGAE